MKNLGHHGEDQNDVDQPADRVERQRGDAPNQQQRDKSKSVDLLSVANP
jgi:hypothetical protein